MQKESSTPNPVPGAVAAPQAAAPNVPGGKPNSQLGGRIPLRILAADDVRTNRELIRQLLGFFGYEVEIVENGAEVLAALGRRGFDLILLDVQMPVMDGLEAAREIVRLQPDPGRRPKMVALTASSSAGDREACLAAGINDCLAKPISPKAFEACVVRLFAGNSADDPDRGCRAGSPNPAGSPMEAGSGDPALQPTTSSRPNAPPLIDLAGLATAIPGLSGAHLAAVQRRMHRAVARDFETIWPRVVEAVSRQDQVQLAEALHALKGCFSTVAWSRIAGRCTEALQRARARQFAEGSTFPSELQQLYAASTTEMTRCLAAVDPQGPPTPPSQGEAKAPQ